MWKANLNRHFAKSVSALKISAFLILWSGLFHSFTLSILLFWSLTSNRVSSLTRMTTLNQFLSENQILFATLSSMSAILFFKTPLVQLWKNRRPGIPLLLRSGMRGFGFGTVMITALILNHDYEFLGLSTQLNINFLAAYAWVFRAILIFGFVFSTEFLVRIIIHDAMAKSQTRTLIENTTLILIYWVWFSPKPAEIITLGLLFWLFNSFWASVGFLSSFFILTHAILGLNFFENESSGILQLKSNLIEESILQNPHLQIMLFILLILIHYAKLKLQRETQTR
jgi:hypothetical protein